MVNCDSSRNLYGLDTASVLRYRHISTRKQTKNNISTCVINPYYQQCDQVQCEANPCHQQTIANSSELKVERKERSDGGKKANSGVYEINLRSVFAHTYAGHDKESVKMFETIMMGGGMHGSQWSRLQPLVFQAVTLEFNESAGEVWKMIQASDEWTVQSDTGWSNRGRTAYHGSLPIIWHEKQLIVLHVVLSKDIESDGEVKKAGNYEGSSGGMEGTALKQVLRELHTRQLLQKCSNIVMDKDSTSTSIINQLAICQHITIRYDPGHAKKSFVNQLLKVRLFSLSLASPLLSSLLLSLSLCVCVSLSLCITVSLSLSLYLSISLSLCLCLSISLALYLSLYLSISLSRCLDVSLCLDISLSLFSLFP